MTSIDGNDSLLPKTDAPRSLVAVPVAEKGLKAGTQSGIDVKGKVLDPTIGIKNKRWIVRRLPFKHMVIPDLFETSVLERLKRNFSERTQAPNVQRSRTKNYDAEMLTLVDDDRCLFSPFLDFEWLRLVSRALSIDPCFEVSGALHSHPVGSRSGWVHNDYNPGWFARSARDGEVYLSTSSACEYKTGNTPPSSPRPICRMRYLTLIYYLNNPPWNPGMGGETGIYLSKRQSIDEAEIFVPPHENTLLVFECTPHSWHTFRTSNFQRNSLTLWLHREFEQAKREWPHHEPVYWS